MLQTNNTGVCSQCLSHTGSAPAHGTCSLPAHTAQVLNCSAGNHPWLALGCLHSPGPSRSGSGTRVVLRGADSRLGLHFVPFPDLSSSGDEVFGAHNCCDLSPPRHSVIWVYNRAPSQADVDRPDPQEVLVSKEACLQFYSVSLGLRLPPSGSGCLSPEGEGLQPAISVQSFVLCAGLAVS